MSLKSVNETYTISDGNTTIEHISKYDFESVISSLFDLPTQEITSVINELAEKAERGDDYSAECAYLDITITLE